MPFEKKSTQVIDASAIRLLGAVGLEDFEYYSARKEMTVMESLQRWPLLRAVHDSITAAARESRATLGSLSSTATVIDGAENGHDPVPLASGGDGSKAGAPSRSESDPFSESERP